MSSINDARRLAVRDNLAAGLGCWTATATCDLRHPWRVEESVTYFPRVVDDELKARLASAGAVLIEGPKACGKTETALH